MQPPEQRQDASRLYEHLTDEEARNAALCILAAESCMCDGMTPEKAVEFARRMERSLDEEPWADGKHCGGCTRVAMSCARCQIEQAEAQAREMYES